MNPSNAPAHLRRYNLQLVISIVVGVILLIGGIFTLLSWQSVNHGKALWAVCLVACFGIVSIVVGCKRWLALSSGKILFAHREAVPLRDGHISLDVSTSAYELWLFCEVPFLYLYGTIEVTTDSSSKIQRIDVPRRSAWLMWLWRSQLYSSPIVWQSPVMNANQSSHCNIKFRLKPAFTDTIYSNLVPVHDVELVTVLVKCRFS